jgi:hypothetical protein
VSKSKNGVRTHLQYYSTNNAVDSVCSLLGVTGITNQQSSTPASRSPRAAAMWPVAPYVESEGEPMGGVVPGLTQNRSYHTAFLIHR